MSTITRIICPSHQTTSYPFYFCC